ncbi:MAG: hypothetical protein R3257_02545, partial [bacterium]|nr:hypothetical protein [bacterium]
MVLPTKHGGASRVLAQAQGESFAQRHLQDHDLLSLADESTRRGDTPLAVSIYQSLSAEHPERSPILRANAQDKFSLLTGHGGPLAQNLEYQAGRFLQEATHPSMVLGMAAGATAFNASRSLILPRLMRSPLPLFSQVPFATRTLASSVALVPEVAAFWGTSKWVHQVMHPEMGLGDLRSNAHEIAGLTMTLGFLKSFGFAFGRMGAWAKQSGSTPILTHPGFWQQSGMLGGIMAAHGTEISLGWRAPTDFSSFFTDALITLTHFNAGGALSHGLFPGVYRLNGQIQRNMAHQERQQLERVRQIPLKEKLGEFVQATAGMRLQEATATGLQINFSKSGDGPKSWDTHASEVTYGQIRFDTFRERVGRDHPELRKILEEAASGNEEAFQRLQEIKVADLVENPDDLNPDTARILMVLTEMGHRESMQLMANHAVKNDGLVTMLVIYHQNGSARVRKSLASISIAPLMKPAEEGNIRAARILELLVELGRSDALEALGHVAPKNAAAMVGLLQLIRKGAPSGQVLRTVREVDIKNVVREVKKGSPRHLDLLSNLMIVGNPKAAQAFAEQAATHGEAIKKWVVAMKTLNSIVAGNLKNVLIHEIYSVAKRDNYFALQVLRDLSSLGNDQASQALKALATERHGPALIVLRELAEDHPEFRADFLEAAHEYGLPVRLKGVPRNIPGATMAFFETLAVNGRLPSVFSAFSEECKVAGFDREGTIRL